MREALKTEYDLCLSELEAFRSKHIQIVARFILAQSKKKAEKGTGGSGIMDLLKTSRSETSQQKFSEEYQSCKE